MKLKIATALLGGSTLVHVYGIITLILALLEYPAWLILTYMVLAILTIPAFIIVRLLSPAAIWRKSAAERNRQEQLFIKLYDVNLLLAVGVWQVLIIVAILHERALRSVQAT